ncbi:tetratricopeptide repeat protein [Alloalcanivorax mobilis]|uniref:tetratricopeptide repeat protein n=1 Tax=Alloalcanivorax mobilis TaxID=2019569 RepID=UPI000C78617A|nr:tetratricopeptide repeat protein [Alloalcanivorax mobilis]|tara:strand:+ start:26332 stop:27009 length:678 start_codon:yes stop_codon:yes gene_type:complete
MQKIILGLVTAVMLGGCAHQPPPPVTAEDRLSLANLSCEPVNRPEDQVQMDMIDDMMARQREHAALAQLESRPLATVDHWLRYGQLLAATGRLDRSEEVFRALVDQCGTGRSHHGLGMVLLKKNDVNGALNHLRIARERTPASAEVRNDYGYVLLVVGLPEEAAYELRTAMELGNGEGPVRQNLAVAYLLTENWAGLQWMTQQYNFTGDERAYAEKLAPQFGRAE